MSHIIPIIPLLRVATLRMSCDLRNASKSVASDGDLMMMRSHPFSFTFFKLGYLFYLVPLLFPYLLAFFRRVFVLDGRLKKPLLPCNLMICSNS